MNRTRRSPVALLLGLRDGNLAGGAQQQLGRGTYPTLPASCCHGLAVCAVSRKIVLGLIAVAASALLIAVVAGRGIAQAGLCGHNRARCQASWLRLWWCGL